MNPEEITTFHRSRRAVVYIRQSTLEQVVHHRESQRRQRGLVERAKALGYLRLGDTVVATAGQTEHAGGTNVIRVIEVP